MMKMGKYLTAAIMLTICNSVPEVECHGRLMDPIARSSAWRAGFPVPPNPNYDNALSCGGYGYQYSRGQGRCGVCGDPFDGPFDNEAGGKYATGIIVKNYTQGQHIYVTMDITKNHGGYSEFRICPNNDVTKRVTQSCLDQYLLATPTGQTRYIHAPKDSMWGTGDITVELVLPPGLTCTQCVIQWIWTADSNNHCAWNKPECCDPSNVGCGNQEHFYGCADVAISSKQQSGSLPFFHPEIATSRTTTTNQRPTSTQDTLIGGFQPINIAGSIDVCQATALARNLYGQEKADALCRHACLGPIPRACPVHFCTNTCRE